MSDTEGKEISDKESTKGDDKDRPVRPDFFITIKIWIIQMPKKNFTLIILKFEKYGFIIG